MAVMYTRSALLSLRSCWRNSTLPLAPSEWNTLKFAGLLKPTQGQRGSIKCIVDGRQHRIQTSYYRKTPGAWASSRRQNSVNYTNLLNIQIVTLSSSSSNFLPSILLSNPMSLKPKINEIAYAITTMDAELAFFTETWLKSSLPDESININGYQIFQRDRVGWQHCSICVYVKSSIKCSVLTDYHHSDHEVLWADLTPSRLPRGFSNIIVGVIYQYPDADDAAMKEYLISSLVSLEAS